jgi:hypothetical protein
MRHVLTHFLRWLFHSNSDILPQIFLGINSVYSYTPLSVVYSDYLRSHVKDKQCKSPHFSQFSTETNLLRNIFSHFEEGNLFAWLKLSEIFLTVYCLRFLQKLSFTMFELLRYRYTCFSCCNCFGCQSVDYWLCWVFLSCPGFTCCPCAVYTVATAAAMLC